MRPKGKIEIEQPDGIDMQQQKRKISEALEASTASQYNLDGKAMDAIIDGFSIINPPQFSKVEERFELFTIHNEGRGGGVSVKPGNILFNWRKLVDCIPVIGLTFAGISVNPWLAFLGGLVIWRQFYNQMKIEIDKNHAITLYTLWIERGHGNKINEERARDLTNERMKSYNIAQLGNFEFTEIVNTLNRIGCLEIENGEIWLREWIRRPLID